jgi:hypothetical protein
VNLIPDQKEMGLDFSPLLEESLVLGDSTVNFDRSMLHFVPLTEVTFSAIREAAESVHRVATNLGLGFPSPTHTYLYFTADRVPVRKELHTTPFLFGPVEEQAIGSIRINQLIFCVKPLVGQEHAATRKLVKRVEVAGHGPDMSLSKVLRLAVIDHLLHEFAHAFGVRPNNERLKGLDLNDIENLTDAVGCWAIPLDDIRTTRELFYTGFTGLQRKEDLRCPVRIVAEDVLRRNKLVL